MLFYLEAVGAGYAASVVTSLTIMWSCLFANWDKLNPQARREDAVWILWAGVVWPWTAWKGSRMMRELKRRGEW